jgi:hypothetical protein
MTGNFAEFVLSGQVLEGQMFDLGSIEIQIPQ